MTKRVTVLLEDDVYQGLLAQAGSSHKISQRLNRLLRPVLNNAVPQAPAPELVARIAVLEQELAAIKVTVLGHQ